MTTLQRAEAAAAQLSLVYGVVPRALAGSLAASRRDVAGLVPPTPFAARQVGAMALDELCIAVFALLGGRPSYDDLVAAAAKVAPVADRIAALGLAGAHPTPPPALLTRRTTVRRRGTTFDLVSWASRPPLDDAFGSGASRTQTAVARVMQHPGEPRPWVLWTHGAGQGLDHDLLVFRANWMHEELGLNLAFPVQPMHGQRRLDGPAYPGFDVLANIAHVSRAVWDVRSLLGWIQHQGAPSVNAVGVSLGSPVTSLVAHLEPSVDAVALLVPMLDMHGTMAHHMEKTSKGRQYAELLRSGPVHTASSVVDALATTPHAHPELRTIIAAQNDRMASARDARRLHDAWGGTLSWYAGGHVGHVFAGAVRTGVEQHLRRWLAATS